jgi:hypothetical protein
MWSLECYGEVLGMPTKLTKNKVWKGNISETEKEMQVCHLRWIVGK